MNTHRSIYADPVRSSVRRSPAARAAQQERAECRLRQLIGDGPTRHLDRVAPLRDVLHQYHRGFDAMSDDETPLAQMLASLTCEVESLERWVAGLPSETQRSGPVIRQALDFLRTFGRLTVLDFSHIPMEERDRLVQVLALEHRWCYAAAGTSRDAFKRATGRTGAR